MGRSQAVRQRILIPPFGGSIPPAPAILKARYFNGLYQSPRPPFRQIVLQWRFPGSGGFPGITERYSGLRATPMQHDSLPLFRLRSSFARPLTMLPRGETTIR